MDLRDNPGFVEPYSKDIFDKLVRNIRLFKETKKYIAEEDEDERYEVIQEQ